MIAVGLSSTVGFIGRNLNISTLCHVYNPTQYSHLIYVLKSPLVCMTTHDFLSLHPSEFHSNVTHLQNALQQISSMDDCKSSHF